MKFLSVRDLKGKSGKVWKDLSNEKEMIVTSNGRPIAILSAVNESNVEEYLAAIRKAKAIQAVSDLQKDSIKRGAVKLTRDEINEEIQSVRKEYHK